MNNLSYLRIQYMHLNVRVIIRECLQVYSSSKAYGDTKDQAIHNAVLVITALAAYI